jgi:hypothetical protein
LVVALLGLAGFYAWRQVELLRQGPATDDEEEDRFKRGLARRRLITSGLLALLGVLLAGALLFLENPAQKLADRQDAREAAGQDRQLTGSDAAFARAYSIYWIVFVLLLLVCVVLAGADFWAIRRYSMRQFQKLREERRAMIERETARLREQRRGPDDVLRN